MHWLWAPAAVKDLFPCMEWIVGDGINLYMRNLSLFHPLPLSLSATIVLIAESPSSNELPARVFLWIGGDFLADAGTGDEERAQPRRICYFNDVFHVFHR